MMLLVLIVSLYHTTQVLSSPIQTIFIPYLYPLVLPRVPNVPMTSPVVIELDPEFTCTEEGAFPDPESCNWYYQCNKIGDQIKEFKVECPPGLNFAAGKGLCDWPSAAGEECKHQPPVETCDDLVGEERKLCQERGVPEPAPVVIELDTEFVCDTNGTFPDPTACNKYFECIDFGGYFESFQYDCPPGLMFNTDELQCDWADLVYCDQEERDVDVCSNPDLSQEEKDLCQNNAWKQFDHFRK